MGRDIRRAIISDGARDSFLIADGPPRYFHDYHIDAEYFQPHDEMAI